MTDRFSEALLKWYDRHGRKDLPWQRGRDPYAIWVSEIMLQQTQVGTVIPYYTRFMRRFPDVGRLARAPIDTVLHHWTGLGYYARARNLHRAAQIVVAEHGGKFPCDLDAVCALPGIGRSTAAAILAFAFNKRHPILDGNVKRVLARYHGVAGWPGERAVETRLWALAGRHTPTRRVRAYTQAIMDLGATLCTRSHPDCDHCPVRAACVARRQGDPSAYPGKAPRKRVPVRQVAMLMIQGPRRRVLLQRRPPSGIWGGLWGFPECAAENDVERWCREALGLRVAARTAWPVLRHSFSHFRLDITPVPALLTGASGKLMENGDAVWYNPFSPDARGLAAPVKKLLQQLRKAPWPES
ncbi:MAG TPA: A/G-specific adenine glycosylase [Acidiferrobacterales bacterium]